MTAKRKTKEPTDDELLAQQSKPGPQPGPPPEPQTFDRALPHNLEAERLVLGTLLLDSARADSIVGTLGGKHFYRDAHRRIYLAMLAVMDEQQRPLDFVTLKDALKKRGELDEVGGPAYLTGLADGLPHSTNLEHYASIVREKSLLREIIHTSNKALSAAYDDEKTPLEILRETDAAFVELQMHVDRRDFVSLEQEAHELYRDLEWSYEHRGQLTGIDTGFKSINEQTFGWQAGDLIVIGARPSIGKSVFMLNSAVAAAKLGKHVAIFSLEMKKRALERRMLSHLSGVPATKIKSGYLSEEDFKRLGDALGALHSFPIHLNDRHSQTAQDIRLACRRLKKEQGLDLVMIDYVQLMPGTLDRRGATRNEELTDISRRMKLLADELGVPIVVLSQLKRIGSSRPTLEDLRESGALEQDGDLVCFLHRKNHKAGGTTEFILEKQRDGPTGVINLSLDRDIQTFTDGGEQTEAQAEAASEEQAQADKVRAIIRHRSRRKG